VLASSLLVACAAADPSDRVPAMALGEPPGPVTLVRTARGFAGGGQDLFVPSRHTLVNGSVWIIDVRNDRLVRFDTTLGTATALGRTGEGPGELDFALDMIVDEERLIVAEIGNSRISVFDTSGTFRTTVPSGRSPESLARVGGVLVAATWDDAYYTHVIDPEGQTTPHARIPGVLRSLARSDPRTYLPAGPASIASGSDGLLYVLDQSVLAVARFDEAGRLMEARLLPAPLRSRLLAQRVDDMRAWGPRAEIFVGVPATKRMSRASGPHLLVLLPLPDHWGLLIDTRDWTTRPLPLPTDPRSREILRAAGDASLYGDRLYIVDETQLHEFRADGWS